MDIRFITDSGADLTPEDTAVRDILVLPMGLNRVSDGAPADPSVTGAESVYRQMRSGEKFTTSQVPLRLILDAFTECARNEIPAVYSCLSGKLSSTKDAALVAREMTLKEYPMAQIEVIDPRSGSVGYGEPLLNACDLSRRHSWSFRQTLEYLTWRACGREHLFTVEDMEFLYRGGRVSKVAFAVASTLGIRPIMQIDSEGALCALEKIRGEKRLLERFSDIILSRLGSGSRVRVVHTDCQEFAENFIELLERKNPSVQADVQLLGPVIGVHTGPGMIGIMFDNPVKLAARPMRTQEEELPADQSAVFH